MTMPYRANVRIGRGAFREQSTRTNRVSIGIAACLMTAATGIASAPAVAMATLDSVVVKGQSCSGIWISDSWGNDSCVSDFGGGGGAGGYSGGHNDWGGGGGGGGRTDTKVADEATSQNPVGCEGKGEDGAPAQGAMSITAKPVLIASGTKVLPEIDFLVPPEDFPLKLGRGYNKDLTRTGAFGPRWSSNIEHTLSFEYGPVMCNGRLDQIATCSPGSNSLSAIYMNGEGGFASKHMNAGNGQWTHANGTTIVQSGTQWIMTGPDGDQEVYDSYGRPIAIKNERGIGLTYTYSSSKLATITHTSGRSISVTWSGSKISAITAPNGKSYGYGYNASGYLTSVVYPDNLGTRTYHYEDAAQPGGLTGISINGVRYSRYKYLANGKVEWSGLEGGVERSSFVYGPNFTEVTTATGHKTHYEYAQVGGKRQLIWVERDATPTCTGSFATITYDSNGNRDVETDHFGVKKDYDYDADGRLLQEISGIGAGNETDQQQITQYVWDATRKTRLNQIKVLGASTSQPLNTTTYTYYPDGDPRARLLQSVAVTNQGGGPVGTLTTTYDYTVHPNGIIATMTVDGPLAGTGDAVVSTYDTAGNLLTVKNSLNHTTTYASYNALGQPGKITNANGGVVLYTYNARGQVLTEKRYAAGAYQTTTNGYDNRGRLISVTTPDGVVTRYAYDSLDRLIQRSRDEQYSSYASSGSGYGLMASAGTGIQAARRPPDCEIDPEGCNEPPPPPPPPTPTIRGSIDGVTSDNGAVRGWACASTLNGPIDIHMYVGGAAGAGSFAWAGTANLPSEPAVASACSASGTNYRFSIPLSRTLRQQYGGQAIYIHGISPTGGSNLTITRSGSFVVPVLPPPPTAFERYSYNLLSQITRIETGIEYTPDSANPMLAQRPTGVAMARLPDCDPSSPDWPDCDLPPPDPEPTRIMVVQTTHYIDYDAGGFVSKRRGGNGQSITYHYNANGDVDSQTDALGNTTWYGYDRLRRVNHIKDAAGGSTWMAYTPLGQTLQVTDPRGLATSYVYDGLGNLLSQTSPDTGTTSFTYNAQGQRIQQQRADGGTLAYTYDALGRLKTQSGGGQTRTLTYDACTWGKGLLCTAAKTGGTATTTKFTYTTWAQVATRQDIASGVTDTTAYSYDGSLRLTGISYPSGVSVGYGYADGHLSLISATINGVTTNVATPGDYRAFGPAAYMGYGNGLWRQMNFDASGRLTGISTNDAGGPLQSLTYGFDAADRITAITNGVDADLTRQFGYDAVSRVANAYLPGGNVVTFGYDAGGNRTVRTDSGSATSIYYGVAGDSNRLQYASQTGVSRYFNADENGNTVAFTGADGIYNGLTYDPFGRLASHSRSGIATTYTVNALDQRTAKSNATANSRYSYAGFNQLLAENTNGHWTSYIWNGSEPVALVRNNQIYYVHNDHLGRPHLVTNGSKAVAWKASNWIFERDVTQDGIGGLNLGFPGQYYDSESRLWHNGYREYLADAGRYLQSDPVGLAGGLNTYAYVGGNPISRIDPFGLTQCDIDAAFDFAKKMNPDIKFGAGAPKPDIPRGGVEGEAQLRGGDGYIHLNERYLDVLDWSGVYNLLDTIIHEGMHFTRPIKLQEKSNNYDHRYISPEATRRAREQVYDFNKERKSQCGCDQ